MRKRNEMPFGAAVQEGGVDFRLWAPSAPAIAVVLDGRSLPMKPGRDGWHSLFVPGIGAGARYRFRIGDVTFPDPASRFQPEDITGASAVVDNTAFSWSDEKWIGRRWEEAVFVEVHIGTATRQGTYAALQDKLPHFRDAGFTAVELMPISDFPGSRSWGYDGVLPFAPDSAYGSPDDLKRLIDRAHALGLMMFLDVVYNHFGPSGNFLPVYAEHFFTNRHQTPWGAGINFDGGTTPVVRDYFIHNALYWLEEYHFDGLRLDAVHAIRDTSAEHIVAEIATRIRRTFPGRYVHLVLENEANIAKWLSRETDGTPALHSAQWADDIHNAWHAVLTGETAGYYMDFADDPLKKLGRSLAEGFSFQGEYSTYSGRTRGQPSAHLPPTAFVAFLQNHDQIGNRVFGERLTTLVPPHRLALARAVLLLCPQIPLLFMGEEWGSTDPFQYFVDFSNDPDLSSAIREGRSREFSGFFSSIGADVTEMPDPTDCKTFENSRLDWSALFSDQHDSALSETRRLIAIRMAEIVPLIASRFIISQYSYHSRENIEIIWRFETGILRLLINVGEHDIISSQNEDERVLWMSESAASEAHNIILPGWSGAVLTSGTE